MASRRYAIVGAALLSIAALVGTATVFAQGGQHGHRGFGVMGGLQQLGLSRRSAAAGEEHDGEPS